MQREVPAEPRRLHLRRQVRHPRLAGRRAHQRARDGRPRGRRRHRAQAAARCAAASRSSPGSRKVGTAPRRVRPRARHARARSSATPIRCPDPGDGRADDRGRRGGAQGRRTRSAAWSTCAVRGCPPGWGEPVFDRLEADLAKAMLSLPASKGFEIGSGFAGTDLTGLEHNDEFYMDGDRGPHPHQPLAAASRAASRNGETIYFRVAFKPTATIMREQQHRRASHHEDTTLTGARPPRPVRAAARRADGGGDGRAGAGRPRPPASGGHRSSKVGDNDPPPDLAVRNRRTA